MIVLVRVIIVIIFWELMTIKLSIFVIRSTCIRNRMHNLRERALGMGFRTVTESIGCRVVQQIYWSCSWRPSIQYSSDDRFIPLLHFRDTSLSATVATNVVKAHTSVHEQSVGGLLCTFTGKPCISRSNFNSTTAGVV